MPTWAATLLLVTSLGALTVWFVTARSSGRNAPTRVTASRGSIAAGGNVVAERDIVVNQYDQAEARSRDRRAFFENELTFCRTALDAVSAFTPGKGVLSGMVPPINAYGAEYLGLDRFEELNRRRREFMALHNQLRIIAVGASASPTPDAIRQFESVTRNLTELMARHCEELSGLTK